MRETVPYLILVLFFAASKLGAQNLVPNNGFDVYSVCPSTSSQSTITPPWFNPAQQTGTPDYMNACFAGGQQGVPANFYGNQQPVSPNGYYGMITYYGGGSEVREYMCVPLSQPLVANQPYYVGFSVSLSDNFEYATDHFGAYLSAIAPVGNGTSAAMSNYIPQIDHGSGNVISDKTNWTLIAGYYTAQGGEQYLTIGNFYDDNHTVVQNVSGGALQWAYYYVDEAFVISNPHNLQVSGDTIICTGDSTVLAATGGGPYRWKNRINPTVVISSDSILDVSPDSTTSYLCISGNDSLPVTVHVNPLPVPIITSAKTFICQYDSVAICVSGNFASYKWPSGETGSCITVKQSGTYHITVTDINGCSAFSNQLSITVDTVPPVSLVKNKSVICSTDSAQICTNSTFAAYQWNNSGGNNQCIEAKQAGNYYVTVTDATGCTAESNHVSISVYPIPSVSIVQQGDTLSSFGQVSYQWLKNGYPIINADLPIFVVQESGLYSVEVTDTNGCTAISNPINITVTGIAGVVRDMIQVYPNPTTGGWQMETIGQLTGSKLEIYDEGGRLVYLSEVRNSKSEINLNVAGGIYFLHIYSPGVVIIKKLIKL